MSRIVLKFYELRRLERNKMESAKKGRFLSLRWWLLFMFIFIGFASFSGAETFNHKSSKGSKDAVKEPVIEKGTACSDTNPLCKNGHLTYIKHDKWDTPFNPHEILNNWTVVNITMIPPGLPFITMGNPKIDWKRVPAYLDPSLAILPEGEEHTAIFFTFVTIPIGSMSLNQLIIIGYRDLSGGGLLVTHTFNKEKMVYEITPEKERLEFREKMKQGKAGVITCSF